MIRGLSVDEVASRRQHGGYNELHARERKARFWIIIDVIKEPMFLLLLACSILYLVLGDVREGIMLICSIFFIIGISIYQNKRTEKALAALKSLSAPVATVMRDGVKQKIPAREIVTDDIILVSEGDRVPADAILLSAINLSIDESLLTGESVPVRKKDTGDNAIGGNDPERIFSGTLVVEGKATARVEAIGDETQIGQIGRSMETINAERTKLQAEIDSFIKRISVIGILLCLLVIVLYALARGSWLNGILVGLSLSMSILPEEFPVVFTIFMALGAWRIARVNVVTRKPSAIEALGAATVLCVDKTGTITRNKMQVSCLYANNAFHDIDYRKDINVPEEFHEVMEYGILATPRDPFDPMEQAIIEAGDAKLSATEHIHKDWRAVKEYPLSSQLLAMSRVYGSSTGNYLIAVKGAPEAVFDLCHTGPAELVVFSDAVQDMARKGLRVLAVARAFFPDTLLPGIQHDFDFRFCGLIGLSDPIREEIPEAVKQCYDAGIRIIMITGDYPATAQNIAEQIGLNNHDEVLTGTEMAGLSPKELAARMRSVNIFARIAPGQKLLIVNSLKESGEIVAMTGDGVNDAPALKGAHIGIAMGKKGTDVAREAASLILLDDNFASIVTAIKLGRRIFDNIQKAWSYLLSIHIPIIGLALMPVFFGHMPLILMPAHIIFMELIIDPVASIAFENEKAEADIMNRKPRSKQHKFFSRKRILTSLAKGLSVLVSSLIIYVFAANLGCSEGQVRAMTFTTLILSNLLLVLSDLSETKSVFTIAKDPNLSVKVILGAALLFLAAVLYIPLLRGLFHLELFPPSYYAAVAVVAVFSIGWSEIIKLRRVEKSRGEIKGANV
jgi:Ca2+-transporting ATPase